MPTHRRRSKAAMYFQGLKAALKNRDLGQPSVHAYSAAHPIFKDADGNEHYATRTKDGRMSYDGKTAGGYTNTFSDKDENGVRRSGRNGKFASRRQRYYDVRQGLGLVGG